MISEKQHYVFFPPGTASISLNGKPFYDEADIAEAIGVERSTISRWRKRAKLEPRIFRVRKLIKGNKFNGRIYCLAMWQIRILFAKMRATPTSKINRTDTEKVEEKTAAAEIIDKIISGEIPPSPLWLVKNLGITLHSAGEYIRAASRMGRVPK